MKNIFFVSIIALCFTSCNLQNKSKIELLTLQSQVFKNERLLRVYLPADYNGIKSFRVLYLNDGQHLFESDKLHQKEDWRVDEITDSLIKQGIIEPLIIVGIDNIGTTNRGDEYLPWEDIYLNPPIPNPKGKMYPDFIINEVMPLIESKYKIKKGKENVGIGGFSYGGLIAIYTAMKKPDHFGFLLAETPSLYVNDNQILKEAQKSSNGWPARIYFGVGTNELGLKNCEENNADNRMAVSDIRDFISIINNNKCDTKTEFNIVKCATHSFEEASKRLPKALEFLLN